MSELTFNILKIVVAVATVFVSMYIVPLIREKLTDSKYKRLLEMVEIAVKAAEQTIKADGAVKKDEVVKFVTQWMLAHGIAITQDQLDQLIEAAVWQLHQEAK